MRNMNTMRRQDDDANIRRQDDKCQHVGAASAKGKQASWSTRLGRENGIVSVCITQCGRLDGGWSQGRHIPYTYLIGLHLVYVDQKCLAK